MKIFEHKSISSHDLEELVSERTDEGCARAVSLTPPASGRGFVDERERGRLLVLCV